MNTFKCYMTEVIQIHLNTPAVFFAHLNIRCILVTDSSSLIYQTFRATRAVYSVKIHQNSKPDSWP